MSIVEKALNDASFIHEMKQLNDYARNIKLERPIVFLLAKYAQKFSKKRDTVILECKKHRKDKMKYDICIDGKYIEVKYHFEHDILSRLEKDLDGKSIKELMAIHKERKAGGTSLGWNLTYHILKDICYKDPDLFIWIIAKRNLSSYHGNIDNVCVGKNQLNYEDKPKDFSNGKKRTRNFKEVINKFIEKANKECNLEIKKWWLKEPIVATKPFRTEYHFLFCQFAQRGKRGQYGARLNN